jgi:hypothetical protein
MKLNWKRLRVNGCKTANNLNLLAPEFYI